MLLLQATLRAFFIAAPAGAVPAGTAACIIWALNFINTSVCEELFSKLQPWEVTLRSMSAVAAEMFMGQWVDCWNQTVLRKRRGLHWHRASDVYARWLPLSHLSAPVEHAWPG